MFSLPPSLLPSLPSPSFLPTSYLPFPPLPSHPTSSLPHYPGCLKDTQVTTPPGLRTVFLLKDHDLRNLSFSYTPKTLRPHLPLSPVSLSLVLTPQDLEEVPEGSWVNITIVWNSLEDNLGVSDKDLFCEPSV